MCNQCKQRTVKCKTCTAPKPLGTSPDTRHPSRGRLGRGNNVEATQATSFESQASLPEVPLFGWQKKANQWQPVWITIAEVAITCRDPQNVVAKKIAAQKGAAAMPVQICSREYES